ncbi:hypothetical protein [Candidatus Magnetobacterium casense]|uniref:Transposase n=1 Tax=Candidatus Magnetobacterium casense TaxID=1455061 RepID=A0ABS6RYV5_9BACT|nr:hypothetical protein [Candidatus Magnetobacterium casensis]MBV6340968.1 hypothetical protein [Candidatus Magnetobacterium casensis]
MTDKNPPEYAVYYPEVEIPYPWEEEIARLRAELEAAKHGIMEGLKYTSEAHVTKVLLGALTRMERIGG